MVTALPALLACVLAQAAPEDIALGKGYAWQESPRYGGCTEDGDAVQLKDGKYNDAPGLFWLQAGAVGWQDTMPVVVTIDLGTVQPIAGVSYSTASDTDSYGWHLPADRSAADRYRIKALRLLERLGAE